ncbi:MAG: AmmeMemoRadiSam system protein B [Candidatus Cloacimonadaceae bacterium]|nr:AmmeMemoRadiSam system protein B [Candidatus Cloacimonadaceae bacterium]
MIRKAAHAGSFYPRFAQQIERQISGWIQGVQPSKGYEDTLGIIVPHAGYIYSGQCAALAYQDISQHNFDSFIILHPCHQGNHFDYSVSAFEEYETPLGNIMLDLQLYETLSGAARDKNLELRLHESEHSMEIQLPLIKHFFPNARICPVMFGRQTPEVAQRLAMSIYEILKNSQRRIGIIVSTDLSHYHNSEKAAKLDKLITKYIMSFDPDALWQSVISGRCEACGIGGIITLLDLAKRYEDAKSKLIQYTHSGKSSGDNLQVVGYLSAKIFR